LRVFFYLFLKVVAFCCLLCIFFKHFSIL
jgi:hypothetical protein